VNRALVLFGISCILCGLVWPWLRHLPLGRLPGDIVILRDNFRLFLPVTSSVLISLVISLLFWLFKK
jgi:hypothetical protein